MEKYLDSHSRREFAKTIKTYSSIIQVLQDLGEKEKAVELIKELKNYTILQFNYRCQCYFAVFPKETSVTCEIAEHFVAAMSLVHMVGWAAWKNKFNDCIQQFVDGKIPSDLETFELACAFLGFEKDGIAFNNLKAEWEKNQ